MGKSTLFNIIAGIEEPDEGDVELGKTVSLGFVSQSRDELSGRRTVYEEISGDNEFVEIGGDRINTRAYIASFNLRGGMQEKKVGSLSGGERNRVHLAKMLLGGHNVVMLDEPTNDLDVDTLRSLEAALSDFDGVSMVISTTDGSWTASARTSSPSRATATSSSSMATTPSTSVSASSRCRSLPCCLTFSDI